MLWCSVRFFSHLFCREFMLCTTFVLKYVNWYLTWFTYTFCKMKFCVNRNYLPFQSTRCSPRGVVGFKSSMFNFLCCALSVNVFAIFSLFCYCLEFHLLRGCSSLNKKQLVLFLPENEFWIWFEQMRVGKTSKRHHEFLKLLFSKVNRCM